MDVFREKLISIWSQLASNIDCFYWNWTHGAWETWTLDLSLTFQWIHIPIPSGQKNLIKTVMEMTKEEHLHKKIQQKFKVCSEAKWNDKLNSNRFRIMDYLISEVEKQTERALWAWIKPLSRRFNWLFKRKSDVEASYQLFFKLQDFWRLRFWQSTSNVIVKQEGILI